MALDKPIVIGAGGRNWNEGMGDSPYTGFYNMENVETDTNAGTVRLNYQTVKESATTITDLPVGITFDATNGDWYIIDEDHKVYKSTDDGDSWTQKTGNTIATGVDGIVWWKDHLFVMRVGHIDVLDIAGDTWTNAWKTITNQGSLAGIRPGFVSKNDDKLYIGNGNEVIKIEEISGKTFDPSDSTTYSIDTSALTLLEDTDIVSIEELGSNLMLGTRRLNDTQWAKIFPWDRADSNPQLPVEVRENGIRAMIQINNLIWFFAGKQGKLFVTNGSTYEFIKRIPQELLGLETKSVDVYPAAIMQRQKKIYFGLSTSQATGHCGVWTYSPDTQAFKREYTISTGETGENNNLLIGIVSSLKEERFSLMIGWKDVQSTAQGIDRVGNSISAVRYSTGAVESEIFQIGTGRDKGATDGIEVIFAEPLTGSSAEGVTVSYRENLTASYTSIATVDAQTNGNIISHIIPFQQNLEQIQLKIQLNGATDNPVNLKTVIIH